MKLIKLLIIVLFHISISYSQEKDCFTITSKQAKINCIINLLSNDDIELENISAKIKLINSFAFQLLSNSNSLNKNEEKLIILITETNFNLGNYDNAIQLSKRVLHKKVDKKAYFNGILGQVYLNKRALDSSEYFFNQAIVIAKQNNEQDYLASVYDNLGYLYFEKDDKKTMFDYFFKALKIKEKLHSDDLWYSYISISNNFRIIKDYEKSELYCEKAINSLKNTSNNQGLLYSYIYKSHLLLATEKYSNAEMYCEKSIEIAKKETDYNSLANSILILGLIKQKQGKIEEAIEKHLESLTFFSKINRPIGQMQCFNALSQDYFSKDSIVKNKFDLDKSLDYALKAKELSKVYGIPDDIRYNSKLLKKIYLAKNDFKNAYNLLSIEKTMNDSILKSKNDGLEKELEFLYSKKKEVDDLKNKQKIEQQKASKKLLYYIISMLILIAIIMYFSFINMKNKKEVIIAEQKATVENKQKVIIETELNYLKAQINPHFLFNVLNAIYFKIDKKNSNAREALLGFSEILRYQLYECNLPKVPIEKEIKYIKDYIHLQLLRKNDNDKCRLTVEDTVKSFQIAPLILITFLENAFKYLRSDKEKINEIEIKLNYINDCFVFEISNPKNNSNVLKILDNKGIGIANVRRRLDLIYEENYSLVIEDENELFKVVLKIELK
ncbi:MULTISPECIES: histidine kinase [Flavobacterium]|uniref:Histidine kinase n=1 Tax=Flavobacterium jumunjinense TaxID=998845 RepID=A0ABV5GJD9_9FLAO|nr:MULTISPECIES: histidine kinase [Flavobacterium]